jgi:hypothetical protein
MPRLSDLDEAFCRIHMLEFILKSILVNQLLPLSEAESDAAKQSLVHRMQNPRGSGNEKQFAMVQRIGQLAERFVAEVAEAESATRAGEIPRTQPATQ